MTMTWRYKKLTPVICFPRDLLYSEAFKKLSGQTARVYWFFLAKKKMEKGPDGKWMIANDGEICFPYSEAPKHGIGKTSFKRAIDELVNHGFIKIAHQGNGHRQ